jgi:hypothetical protein
MLIDCARRSLLGTLLFLLVAVAAVAENVDTDPRFQRPPLPVSLDELVDRFLPGHVPLTPRGNVVLAQGEAYAFNHDVTAGVCYAVAAIGLGGIRDLDVRLRRSGRVVSQDVQLDGYPVVHYCPASVGDIRVELRAFDGSGSAEFQILVDPNAYYSARGALDELSNRLESATARTAPRWMPMGPQWRNQFPRPGTRQLTFEAEAGDCYSVVAVGQASVLDVDLRLRLEERELDVDRGGSSVAAVATCAAVDQSLTVDVAVVRGQGVVAAQVLVHSDI